MKGSVAIVVAVVRVLIGTLFLWAGVVKIGHFSEFAAAVAGFRLLPESVLAPLAVFLPFFETLLGLYLIAGLFVRAAAIVGAVQLAIYAGVIASAVVRHISANCGCFGSQDRAPADWPHAFADLALAVVCAAVAYFGPGAFAVDNRLRKT